ncbi:MAG: SIS domain-containing protein [Nitrospinae bacterium]|nr:SIS domain-containing protein [Nitrospinota bacterium]
MIPMDDPRRPMYDEVLTRPAFIRTHLDELDDLVRATLPREACQRWTRVLLTGCGDSYYAGLACELAFETCTDLPVDVHPSLHGGRYAIPSMTTPAVVFSVSHSGQVSRTIETVALAHARGLETVAVSGTPGSPITQEAAWVLARKLQVAGRTPGVRSYTQAQLLLILSAIYIGECRGALDHAQAAALKGELRRTADILDTGLEETDAAARAIAEEWREANQFLVVSGGPSYANALFSAAKLVEACGVNAVGQELEEWAHIQFFLRSPRLPTILIAPPGRCSDRAIELLEVMRGLGCLVAVVGAANDHTLMRYAHRYFSIRGTVGEAFSPLLTSMPAELLACHLAHLSDERFFRADGRGVGVGRGRITDSRIVRGLQELTLPFTRRAGDT